MIELRPNGLLGFDIPALIQFALEDPELHRMAFLMHATALENSDPEQHESRLMRLSVSSMGKCALEHWRQLHDETMPPPWHLKLARFDEGTQTGSLLAALASVAIIHDAATNEHAYFPQREAEVYFQGFTGHVDLRVLDDASRIVQVVEFKKSFGWSQKDSCKPYHKQQVWGYHRGSAVLDTQAMSVVTYLPSMKSYDKATGDAIVPQYLKQWDFDASHYDETGEAELKRLSTGLDKNPPECDATEDFRARGCLCVDCPLRARLKKAGKL